MRNERKTQVTIYYCGREACKKKHFFGPAVRPHYLIHFVLNGKGIYRIEKGKKENIQYEVNAGEAFLIRPGEITYYQADAEDPWEYVWIAFDGEEAERVLEERGLLQDQYVCTWVERQSIAEIRKVNTEDSVRQFLRAMSRRFEQGQCSQMELKGYFYFLFDTIAETTERRTGNREGAYETRYLEKAVLYIRHNYGYDIRVSDVAQHVGIERTYLFKLFKKYKECSPKAYLTEYRLMVAKDMLGSTRFTITEIALSCGFHDSSVFCKTFMKKEGTSPLRYRNISHKTI
ncbi:MAG: AraC family transcriptional regulator [Lachnospiraceae bacterium]|nr:AraC family transcriptional regulator [Lachnospiraceae bacterium]